MICFTTDKSDVKTVCDATDGRKQKSKVKDLSSVDNVITTTYNPLLKPQQHLCISRPRSYTEEMIFTNDFSDSSKKISPVVREADEMRSLSSTRYLSASIIVENETCRYV